jgi:2-dehydropantoate 2-reductase
MPLRFLIAGAGAIGGYIGALMSRAGEDVTLLARGAHLEAMRARGLRVVSAKAASGGLRRKTDSTDVAAGSESVLRELVESPKAASDGSSPEGEFETRPRLIGDLREAGPADVIILGVKAHSLTGLAPQLTRLIGENTVVVSTQNGVPWWYFQIGAGDHTGLQLESVDPGGVISRAINPPCVIGSIVYLATEIVEPGIIRHDEGNRISIGEPDGTRSERVKAIADVLIKAGLRCPVTTRIRHEIWVKLLGNVAFNPLSALTRATLAAMARDPGLCGIVRNIMSEVEAVANRLGIELPISADQRIAGAEKAGEHKTSMLQDLELARPMELEPVVGAVVELGDKLGVPMPHTRTVYASTKLLEATLMKMREATK